MTIHQPHLCTKLDIWAPRYSDAHKDDFEQVALLAQYKVHHSSSVIIINFTKAKHLAGQRFCITRDAVQHCKVDTNGKIPCYAVPMSKLEPWESAAELRDIAFGVFE